MTWFIVMPMGAQRFGRFLSFPLWDMGLGGVMLLPALYFIYHATGENTFLSTRVRIQSERGQQVISTGV